MKAVINHKGFDLKESKKLKPFLEIANHFAKKWGRKVILDIPHGKTVNPFEPADSGKTVRVHFLSNAISRYHAPSDWAQPSQLKNIFGFILPEEGGENSASPTYDCIGHLLPFRSSSNKFIYSNETIVAQVVENHLFILFDLSHKPWEGDKPVFWEILERATRYIALSGEYMASLARRELPEVYIQSKRSILAKKEKILRDFSRLSGFWPITNELEARRLFEGALKDRVKLESEITALGREDQITRELIETFKEREALHDKELEEEFDALLDREEVWGIKINTDTIVVYTKPIKHIRIYEHNAERRETLLSQFEITISMELVSSGAQYDNPQIKETPDGWRSQFWHPGHQHLHCRGPYIVDVINKALADRDVRAMIHYALAYLSLDRREPISRVDLGATPTPYEPKPFYENDEKKNEAREAYIKLVKKYTSRARIKILEQDLAEINRKAKEKRTALLNIRNVTETLRVKLNFLCHLSASLKADSELADILALKSLSFLEIGSDFIWLVFGPGRGFGKSRNIWFNEELRLAVRMKDEKVQITNTPNQKSAFLEDRVCVNVSKRYLEAVSSSSIKRAFWRGRVGQLVCAVFKFLRGSNSGIRDLTGVKPFSEKEIKKFIEEALNG